MKDDMDEEKPIIDRRHLLMIDGSRYEGGGQILRTALALSIVTKKPFQLNNIRAKRPQSGLTTQHVKAVISTAEFCDGHYSHVEPRTQRLRFYPGDQFQNKVETEMGTAGSLTLLLQALLIPAFYSPKTTEFRMKGGTDVKWSMPYDFLEMVLIPQLRRFGLNLSSKLIRRGYYPRGGGGIYVITEPADKTREVNFIEQGEVKRIGGICHASLRLKKKEVAEKQVKVAEKVLKTHFNCDIDIEPKYYATESDGFGMTLWLETKKTVLGADSLGENVNDLVGETAARKLINEAKSGAAVDQYTADNLIPYLALFGGKMKTSKVTLHTQTNMWVCEQFLNVKFSTEGNLISVNKF